MMSGSSGDTSASPPLPQPLRDRRVAMGVSGSIAAYKSFELARRLEDAGATVDVVLTRNASRFAPAFTFRNLVRGSVVDDMWTTDDVAEVHVAIGQRADVFVVAPASATTIAKMAQGIGDSMVSLTALATPAPMAVAPAMDATMYASAAVQANVETLKARGVVVIGPERGRLASGAWGIGRMVEPVEIAGAVRGVLGRTSGDLRGRHVVVTAGGTREPIDAVRFVGNRSSGRMGFALAEAARDRGAAVTLVTTQAPPPGLYGVVMVRVETALEMQAAIGERLPGTDALVMAAAVADYRPTEVVEGKIKKSGDDGLTVAMEQNPDILREASGRLVKVGFAAETDAVEENARAKVASKGLDLIVANDVSAADSGFGAETNAVTLIGGDGVAQALPLLHKYDVAMHVLDRVATLLAR